MSGVESPPDLLVLHALRLKGMAEPEAAAARFGLDRELVSELLLDFEAYGWATHSRFADLAGWSLTEAGRRENEQRLAAELAGSGARGAVAAAHRDFLPLNARFQEAITRWQIHPTTGDPLAANDHSDLHWDEQVLDTLEQLGRRLTPLCDALTSALARFDGYDRRYGVALVGVMRGKRRLVDAVQEDSCHRVWFELHEDLIATLGIDRGQEERDAEG